MKNILFIMVGFMSAAISMAFGYDMNQAEWWFISIPIIIVFNGIIMGVYRD